MGGAPQHAKKGSPYNQESPELSELPDSIDDQWASLEDIEGRSTDDLLRPDVRPSRRPPQSIDRLRAMSAERRGPGPGPGPSRHKDEPTPGGRFARPSQPGRSGHPDKKGRPGKKGRPDKKGPGKRR